MANSNWRIVIFFTCLLASAALADNTLDYIGHPCKRECRQGDEPKVCDYTFVIERYVSMSKACYNCPYNVTDCFRPHCIPADGVKKVIYSINRQMPGPTIEVCENDIIQVEVINKLLSESTTMHWHGIRQFHTPLMDGTPFITQCPILPGNKFIYNFTATDSGTFLYHSHIGFQAIDGLSGSLIIHKTLENQDKEKYDIYGEHIVMIKDWTYPNAADNFEFMNHDHRRVSDPSTLLINGLGYKQYNGSVYSPTAEFIVEQDKSYRFRVIHGGFDDCPIRMIIDKHEMQIFNLDGSDIQPVTVDAITIWSGERVDFVMKANQESDVYFIRFVGSTACEEFAHQVAFLRYEGVTKPIPDGSSDPHVIALNRTPRILNPFVLGKERPSEYNISIPKLHSLKQLDDPSLTHYEADYQFYFVFDFYQIDHTSYQHPLYYSYNDTAASGRSKESTLMNYISLKSPTIPLNSQWDSIDNQTFCSEEIMAHQRDCLKKHCECTHKLDVPLNSVVELVLVDEGTYFESNHPFHLHGHSFRVVAEENLDGYVTVDQVKQLDREGKIQRNLKDAPLKDTVKVPSGGYTIIRFFANNPGYWLFHCHIEQHSHLGMGFIVKVGEHQDFPPVPKDFPKCGHYTG